MLHLIARLDADHDRAVRVLADEVASAIGVPGPLSPTLPHMTLLAFTGLDRVAAEEAVRSALPPRSAFWMRAHGYGVWAGTGAFGPSLHVPVVRTASLDALHGLLLRALTGAGAEVAGWTRPEFWSPHITIVAPVLGPEEIGRAVAHLLQRHHPSWHLAIDEVQIVAARSQPDAGAVCIPLGS